MEQQIFCDGIGRISIIGGVVRLDLFTYSPTETDANGQPRPILSHRIVMGVDGFMRSSEKVLEAAQIATRARQQGEAPQPAPQQPAPQSQQPVPLRVAPTPPPPQPPASPPQPPDEPPAKPPFP
jgi:hypothetical protein